MFISLVCAGTAFLFWYPFKYRKGVDAERTVPKMAALNYIFLVVSYVIGCVFKQVCLRSITDVWVIIVASGFMMFAYVARESDDDWCIHQDSMIQGHAIWHASMAVGVFFFYCFLRQERPWVANRKSSLAEGGEWMEREEGGKNRISSGVSDFFRKSSASGNEML